MRKKLDLIRYWLSMHRAFIVIAVLMLIAGASGGKTMMSAVMGY